MKTNRQDLFTGVNNNSVYNEAGVELFLRITLYRTYLLYHAQNVIYRKSVISDHVDLEVYGAIIEQFYVDADGEEHVVQSMDSGPLSGQQYEVSYLVNNLVRMPIGSLDQVAAFITEEKATWNKNIWGNPFGKAAENALKEKRRREAFSSTEETHNYQRSKKALARFNHESVFLSKGNATKGGLNI
jgi:hypothetical protein